MQEVFIDIITIVVIIIIVMIVIVMIVIISSQQLCRDCVLGQFRDKWHNCITGSNQEDGDYYDYYS